MRILITGSNGLLGPYVVAAFKQGGNNVFETSRTNAILPCDIADKKQAKALIEKTQPDIVVNLAALTDVDYCERNEAEAFAANAGIPANLAAALRPHDYLMQVSTDQVYAGTHSPYKEEDVMPLNIYGKSKLEGERQAMAHVNAAVLRVNMFGYSKTPTRQSLSDFFIGAFTTGKDITLFRDIFFSPLTFETLSKVMYTVAGRKLTGVFNTGSREGMSKADFALALAAHKKLNASHAAVKDSDIAGQRAPRPKDMRMDVGRIEKALGIVMPTLKDEVKKL